MTVNGQEVTYAYHEVEQAGYGRQHLYFKFREIDELMYVQDVFPNVEEHFDFLLQDDAYEQNRDMWGRFCPKYFTNGAGSGYYTESDLYNTVDDFLRYRFRDADFAIATEEEEK